MKRETNVEAVSTINYQFTAIPTNFIYLMDNDCYKLFSILLQKETYWNNKGKLNEGYFIKSISELSDELGLSNRKDVHTIIEALYTRNIIDVVVEARKYKTAKFKLNWDIINLYLEKSIYDILEFEEKITKLNRNSIITYTNNDTKCNTINTTNINDVTMNVTNNDTKCNTTIDNINKINNINKNNINIYTSNIIEENSEEIEVIETSISDNNKGIENYEIEEVGLIENPTSEKEEKEIEDNNNTFQLCEVGMLEEKNDDMIETTKKIFYEYLNNFGNGITNMEELTNRAIKFNGWLERQYQADNITYNEYSSMIEECRDKFTSIQQEIQHQNEEKINELQDEFLKSVLLDSKEAKTAIQIKEEKNVETSSIKTKEELIKNLQVFKDSLTNYDNLEDAKHQLHSYCDKNDKLIREYELTSMVGNILSEIDNIKNANKSDLTDFNNQDIETTINDEKAQEIASCEVMDECTNIEDCIASLIEDLEPAVLDKETYIFETSTKLW